ncbi:MAG: outer membrane beta-barrel protein [Flavobacteriales bacterium]|nr:outer membrane beta-barrel protein [Flavobacteriales bacterium]
MKTINSITTILALLLANMLMAQSDTLKVKKTKTIEGKKMKITVDTRIVEKDGRTEIITTTDSIRLDEDNMEINDKEGEKIVRQERIIIDEKRTGSPYQKNQTHWFNFDLGFNLFLNDGSLDMPEGYKDLKLENGKGANFNLRLFEQNIDIIEKRLFLVYGIGFDWNNYRFKNNIDLLKDSAVLSYTVNPDINYKKNKLVSTYLTVPVLIKFRGNENKHGDALEVAAGVQMGYLLKTHQKQKWEDNGNTKRKVKGDYNLDELRLGYSLYFGYGDVLFYAKYYPESAFKKSQGPNVNTLSFGIAFNGFNDFGSDWN